MKRKPLLRALDNAIRDSRITVSNFQELIEFVKKHELWRGVSQYTWLSRALVLVAVLGGIGFVSFIFDYWGREDVANQMSLASFGSALSGFFSEGYDLFVIGGLKYVILVLMEVVIFHFTRRTLEIKTGKTFDTSLQAFIKAQMRMLKVVIFSFVMESVFSLLAGIALGMVDLEWMKPAVILFIQCYFLGYAVIDNYNEVYHMTIKQSYRYTSQYAAVALLVGIVVYVIMLIPFIGTVLGPLVGAVVATITMHELWEIDQDMEWVFIEAEEKKKK